MYGQFSLDAINAILAPDNNYFYFRSRLALLQSIECIAAEESYLAVIKWVIYFVRHLSSR